MMFISHCSNTITMIGNPSLIQELETAKILHELSQQNHGAQPLISPYQSRTPKQTMISRKRKLSSANLVDVHTISPTLSSVTSGRPVSPSTSETDFSIPQIGNLQGMTNFKLPFASGNMITVTPLAPPPRLRRFPVNSPIALSGSEGNVHSSSAPGQVPSSSVAMNKHQDSFSKNMLLQILSNQMINSSQVPACLPLGTEPSFNSNNVPFLALNRNNMNMGPTMCVPVGNSPTIEIPQLKTSTKSVSKKRKTCRMDGCEDEAARRTPYCSKHCGPRKCEHEGCTKCAQGRTRFCIGHGGGRRCQHEGCTKGARDRHFCAFHGGGRRCNVKDCTKLAVGKGFTCTAHGGGRRCQHEKCSKSAQSSSNFCVRHGGGRKCKLPTCSRVARGKLGLCMSHASQQEKLI